MRTGISRTGLPSLPDLTRAAFSAWGLKVCGGLAAALFLLGAGPAPGAPASPFPDLGSGAGDTNSTVITSTRLSFDQQKRNAVFEDNVLVTDPRVKITCDKLTVFFSEDNQVIAIEAEGRVVILDGDKRAAGDKVRYEVARSMFVLSGRPSLQNGRDTLAADVITFCRTNNYVRCEPNARLVIRSEQGGVFKGQFGKEK